MRVARPVKGQPAGAGHRHLADAGAETGRQGAKPATSQEIAKETDQQTQYMISGLKALSSGIAGSSQAARELKTNTDKLAQAYQALAATNTPLSVAKSVQAQTSCLSTPTTGLPTPLPSCPQAGRRWPTPTKGRARGH